MTDLRDQLADFEAAARRLLTGHRTPTLVLVAARPARCHPNRTAIARRLGMTRGAVDRAYWRAVRAGDLTPDRRTA